MPERVLRIQNLLNGIISLFGLSYLHILSLLNPSFSRQNSTPSSNGPYSLHLHLAQVNLR